MLWLFVLVPLCGLVTSLPQSDGSGVQVGPQGGAISPEQIAELAALFASLGGNTNTGTAVVDPNAGTSGGLDQCGNPDDYACVVYFQCKDGEIVIDGAGQIDIRSGGGPAPPPSNCLNPDFPEIPGQCCHIPGQPYAEVEPPPLKTCSDFQECVFNDQCSNDGFIITDGAGLIDIRTGAETCTLETGELGVCCVPPLPPILEFCPGNSLCVPEFGCAGKALVDSDSNSFIDYVFDEVWENCELDGFEDGGICCEPYEVLGVCPFSPSNPSMCVNPESCLGTALDRNDAFNPYVNSGSWTECWLPAQLKGICCEPPYVIDFCPDVGKCVLEADCAGDVMDYLDVYKPYSPGAEKTPCRLNEHENGVCCKDSYGPAAQHCGVKNVKIDTRIVAPVNLKDFESHFAEFPWQAIIFGAGYSFICGATLISDRFLLTAAHCVDGDVLVGDLNIRLGEWQVNSFDEGIPYVDIGVEAVIIHPKFNAVNVHNDIAIIELRESAPINYHINTLCMPLATSAPAAGTRCIASGWGKDAFAEGNYQHILKKVELPYVKHRKCQKLLRKTRLSRFFRLHKSFVCAGGEPQKDVCQGDGGGPLACYNPDVGAYELIGITSWGIGCGEVDIPGVYVNIPYFADWINGITGGSGPLYGKK